MRNIVFIVRSISSKGILRLCKEWVSIERLEWLLKIVRWELASRKIPQLGGRWVVR